MTQRKRKTGGAGKKSSRASGNARGGKRTRKSGGGAASNGRVSKSSRKHNGHGGAAGRAPSADGFHVADVVGLARRTHLADLYRFWRGEPRAATPESEEAMRTDLQAWMGDPALVEDRIGGLGKRLGAVVEDLLGAPGYQKSWEELAAARPLAYLSEYDLEACIAALKRNGIVHEGRDARFERYERRVLGLPVELGDGLRQRRRERTKGLFGQLTLRGHLDQVYADPEQAKRMSPGRLRELYKMYSQESASAARIERLPDGVRALVEKAILEFGGILPKALFERMDTPMPHWNGRRWAMILEQSLIGTVAELDLVEYGIQLKDEALIVFNEVTLAWLRRVAVPGDPDRPHEELTLGIDLVSNLSRFLAYIDENGVRFTVRGEIFKTTEKKILQHLIPNPGRELSREAVLRFIFRFAKRRELIDRTGKRTFAVTAAGREWSARPLVEKQRVLLDFMQEERPQDTSLVHQVRMRDAFMRLLKRLEPGVWYDLMYLPFVARNNYLSTLDDHLDEDQLAERARGSRFHAIEDPQSLAWNLVKWVRQRLFLLGMIDLGYDSAKRPVAMRLTQSASRLLGLDLIGPRPPSRVGSLVVTPDFEVVLFPTGDDAELIHDLDRFCVREKVDSILRFRIEQESVLRALKSHMSLEDIQRLLENHSRTPVPQNVGFSIRDWALRAGLMRLSDELVIVCEDAETLRRLQQDPGARRYVARKLDERSIQLEGRVTPKRMQSLLRELGYLVELGAPVP